ncbi:MAG: SUMF1/EgtB/PvdO family nonheme iron enzyme, partial [Polyangiales bacterium]
STTIDCSYANYKGGSGGTANCAASGGFLDVGAESPKGDGKWGHADLTGNVYEVTIDWYPASGGRFDGYTPTCVDCADLATAPSRVILGSAAWGKAGSSLAVSARNMDAPTNRSPDIGVRCARRP